MMDGVPHAEHHFPSNVRSNRLIFALSIRHAVRHSTLSLKRFAGEFSELVNQAFGYETSARHGVLQLGVPAPLIVVDLSSPKPFCQTEKMIEHVAIMSSQGRREFSFKWAG